MSSPTLQIGLVQFDIAWENPQENIGKLEKLLSQSGRCDLLLLPEMWSTGFSMNPATSAERYPGPAHQWMMDKARELQTAIAGSIAVQDGELYYNRWYCFYPDGNLDRYDKKHLFSYGQEDAHYTSGTERIFIQLGEWKIMPIICYDLRFPVWCRNTESYDLMVVAANWPDARIHHWDVLLQARAIENQCYVAAINRLGKDGNDLLYCGHSQVVDMSGKKLLDMSEREGIEIVTLDKEKLQEYREKFRFLQDRDNFIL